jgi:hypothetical protein
MQFDQPSTLGMKNFYEIYLAFSLWEKVFIWIEITLLWKNYPLNIYMVLKALIEFVRRLKTLWLYALSYNISVGLSQGIFFPDPATQACLCSGCTRTKQIVAGVNARVYELMFRGDFLAYIIMQIDEVHWRDAAGERATQANEAAGVRHLSFLLIMK